MSKFNKCLNKAIGMGEKTKSKLLDDYNKAIESGLDEMESSAKVLNEYHEDLIDRNNKFKDDVAKITKAKIEKDVKPVKEINQEKPIENKNFVPTSNFNMPDKIEVSDDVYRKWKELDDAEKSQIANIKNRKGFDITDKTSISVKRIKEILMIFAAEKRKLLGTLTGTEKKNIEKYNSKIHIGDSVKINGLSFNVIGFSFGKAKVSNGKSYDINSEEIKQAIIDKNIYNKPIENEQQPRLAEDAAEAELANQQLADKDNIEQEPIIKAIENKVASNSEAKINEGLKEADELINKATGVVNVPVSELKTDEASFQNREGLDMDKVNNIVKNFNPSEFDPIVFWTDKNGNKFSLNHHRLKAAQILGLKEIPSRQLTYRKGHEKAGQIVPPTDKKYAEYFAKEISNANRSMETAIERAKVYREKIKKGENIKLIEALAKEQEGKNASFVLNIAALNPNGITIDTYNRFKGSEDKATQKEVDKILDWIGSVRRSYPELTDSHEKELFDFLFNGDSKRIKTKEEFRQKVTSIVGGFDFDASKPLNIAKFKYKSEGEALYDKEAEDLKSQINARQDEITAIKDRFVNPNNPKYIKNDVEDYKKVKEKADEKITKLTAEQKDLQSKLQQLYQDKGKYTNAGSNQGALFQKANQRSAADISKIVAHIQKVLPKVKVVYDEKIVDNDGFPVAGMVKKGVLYINPNYANSDTPIHEAAHILLDALGENKVVKKAIEQLKGTDLWKKTKKRYPKLNEKELANEVLAEAIGREGAGIFDKVADQSKFKTYLDYIFDRLKQLFGLDKNIAKSLAKQIIGGIGTKELISESDVQKNQIIGEKGAQNIQFVKNNLAVAKQMSEAGKTDKEIYLATGWEKGFDGQWRYDLIENQSDYSIPENEINKLVKRLEGGKELHEELGKIFPNLKIYDAYPDLKTLPIQLYENKNTNEEGEYNNNGKGQERIRINLQPRKYSTSEKGGGGLGDTLRRYIRGTFAHELQHAVQYREGFDSGTSVKFSPQRELKERYLKLADKTIQKLKEMMPESKNKADVENSIKEVEARKEKIKSKDFSEEAYWKSAGEVEARNVAKRLDLTPQERKEFLISQTEDVKRIDQLKSESNISKSVSKKKKAPFGLKAFREKRLGSNIEEIKTDLTTINERLKQDITEEEERMLLGIKDAIKEQYESDKAEYQEYLVGKEMIKDFEVESDLNDKSLDELTEAWKFIKANGNYQGEEFDNVRAKIALALDLEQKDVLRNSKYYKEPLEAKSNTRDMTILEKYAKSLIDVSSDFPPLQALSKYFEPSVLDKSTEIKSRGKKAKNLAEAVIKEKNGLIGRAKDVVMHNNAKYFDYMDDGGKLRTNTSGLTNAQKEFLNFYKELIVERNKNLSDELIGEEIVKLDKGFREVWQTEGLQSAMLGLWNSILKDFGKGYKEKDVSVNYNGNLTYKTTQGKEKLLKLNESIKKLEVSKANTTNSIEIQKINNKLTELKSQKAELEKSQSNYSKDFYSGALALIEDIAHVKYMNDLVPLTDAIEFFYKTMGAEEGNDFRNTLEFINHWKNEQIYQKQIKSSAKIDIPLRLLRRLTSSTTMAFGFSANRMNLLIGNYNALRKEDWKHLLKGQERLFIGKGDRKNYIVNKKATDIIDMFDVVAKDNNSVPRSELGGAISKIAFIGQTWGEYQIQGAQFLGYLSDEEMNSFEYDNNGKLKIKDDVKDKKAFKQKMLKYRQYVSNTQGKYRREDMKNFMRYEAGKATAQFKLWIPDFWQERFGKEYLDRHGELRGGSWRTFEGEALKELKQQVKDKGLAKGLWQNKKFMSNVKGLMATSALVLASQYDDDDDDKFGFLQQALSNMLFIIDPTQTKYMLGTPAAGVGRLVDLTDALKAVWDGRWEKAQKKTKKLIPYNKVLDVPEQLGITEK